MAGANLWRLIGALACGVSIGLYLIMTYANPYNQGGVGAAAIANAWGMIRLHAVGLVAAAIGVSPWVLYVVFLAMFFPVGMYLLATPGVFMVIGLADLAFVWAAIRLHVSADRRDSTASRGV